MIQICDGGPCPNAPPRLFVKAMSSTACSRARKHESHGGRVAKDSDSRPGAPLPPALIAHNLSLCPHGSRHPSQGSRRRASMDCPRSAPISVHTHDCPTFPVRTARSVWLRRSGRPCPCRQRRAQDRCHGADRCRCLLRRLIPSRRSGSVPHRSGTMSCKSCWLGMVCAIFSGTLASRPPRLA